MKKPDGAFWIAIGHGFYYLGRAAGVGANPINQLCLKVLTRPENLLDSIMIFLDLKKSEFTSGTSPIK